MSVCLASLFRSAGVTDQRLQRVFGNNEFTVVDGDSSDGRISFNRKLGPWCDQRVVINNGGNIYVEVDCDLPSFTMLHGDPGGYARFHISADQAQALFSRLQEMLETANTRRK